ncbi:MAG: hypothetical protein AAFU73_02090 [Planctomycetota bacterium]
MVLSADASASQLRAATNAPQGLSAAARARAAGAHVVNLRNVPLNQAGTVRDPALSAPVTSIEDSPFQESETVLMRRSELAVFTSSADGFSSGGSAYILDHPDDDSDPQPVLAGSGAINSAGRNIRDTMSADVDLDGEDEILALTLEGPFLQVWQVDVASGGAAPVWTLVHEFAPFSTLQFVTARLVVGDFDGDRRDEIAVFRTVGEPSDFDNDSTVWVLDDPVDGAGVLLQLDLAGSTTGMHARYFGVAADVDADGDDELVVARQGDSSTKGRVRFSLYDWDTVAESLYRRAGPQIVHTDATPVGGRYMVSKAAAGQLDLDPAEEIALASSTPHFGSSNVVPSGGVKFYVDQLNFDVDANRFDFVQRGTYSGRCEATPIPEYCFDVTTVDRFGDGREWIALARKTDGSGVTVFCLREDPGPDEWDSLPVYSGLPPRDDAVTLRAGDSNGNGAQELFLGLSWGAGAPKDSWLARIHAGVTPTTTRITSVATVTSTAAEPTQPLALAVGEFDGDGLLVKYEGTKIRTSNPVPLYLLVAAPNKAGIDQNYIATGTGYSVAQGSGFETVLSTSTSITGKTGFEFDGLADIFGGSVKATIARESRTSNAVSTTETYVTGRESGSDADVIVHASNTYLVHDYRILNAPGADGSVKRFSIDVPLGDAQIFKTEVPIYNAMVRPEYRIETDLLPHTVGDPASYRTFAEMSQAIAPFVSWSMPAAVTVGQGSGGSVYMEIELATENATTEQAEMAAGVEAEFKAYGATVGGSISAGEGAAYTVATNTSTTFYGRIGDIGPSDFPDWAYSAGLVVYQAWRTADANNNPTGWLPGGYPLTVIDYWVEPFGAGY